jgi:hypothetical protein
VHSEQQNISWPRRILTWLMRRRRDQTVGAKSEMDKRGKLGKKLLAEFEKASDGQA